MAGRTQINFRVDDDLLAAMKAHCDESGISQTDFLIGAIKGALGIEDIPAAVPKLEVIDERIDKKLAPVLAELKQLRESLGELAA
jgi:hypothetical protein